MKKEVFMKAVQKAIFIIALVILLPFVCLFGIIKMVDVNKYVPEIAQMVKKETGRDLLVDRVGLDFSFTKGVLLNMDGVRLSDDVSFSKQSFLTMKRFSLNIDVLSLLLERKIRMMNVDVVEPHLIIIRRSDGAVNVASMSSSPQVKSDNNQQTSSKKEQHDIKPLALLIERVMIYQATVTYIDQMFDVPLDIVIKDIDVVMSHFSLTTAFSYEVKAKAFCDIQNVFLKGKASLDVAKQAVLIQNLIGEIDLQPISLKNLEEAIVMIKDVQLKSLKGKISFKVDTLNIDAKGLGSFHIEGFMKEGYLLSGVMPLAFEKIESKFTIDEKNISIDSLAGVLSQGNVFLRGLVRNYMAMPSIALKIDVEDVQMSHITKAYQLPIEMIATLKGRGDVSFAGKTPDEMMVSMRGNGEFFLSQGLLNGQSLLGGLFHKIPMLSNVLTVVAEDLPPSAQKSLTQGLSVIKKGEASLTIEGKGITLNKMLIEADTLTIDTRGIVMMPDRVDMQADVYLEQELSSVFVKKLTDFSNLLQEKRVYIPVSITGVLTSLKIQPDLKYLTEKLLIEQKGKKIIADIVESPKVQKILNSIFGSN